MTKDSGEALELAQKLDVWNAERREIEAHVLDGSHGQVRVRTYLRRCLSRPERAGIRA